MTLQGAAERLTIYIGESDRFEHRPLYTEIVERARRAGMAGATVLRGFEGFGATSHLHTARILRLSEDLPVMIVVIDTTEQIDTLLTLLDGIVRGGIVVREPVEVVTYVGQEPGT